MLREDIGLRLREAMKARDEATVRAVRLIRAQLQEKDVALRGEGRPEGLAEPEIQRLLQAMVKQRRESIALYEKGRREDLAQKEREEIAVIESFLPRQLDEAATEGAIRAVIAETGAQGVKDMGRVMALLRERHAGTIDMARAGGIAKRLLG